MKTMNLSGLKTAVAAARDLDELYRILEENDGAEVLGNRPESEDSIGWIPTFGDACGGDGGEGWERISWDDSRALHLRKEWSDDSWYLTLDDIPTA
jgi:hypothetical protein